MRIEKQKDSYGESTVEKFSNRERNLEKRIGDEKEISKLLKKAGMKIQNFMDEIFLKNENVNPGPRKYK